MLAFFILILLVGNVMSAAQGRNPSLTSSAYTQHDKGILFDVRALGKPNIPSLSDLKTEGFTLVGTYVTAQFGSADWNKVAAWIKSAHKTGLRTFIMVGVPNVNNIRNAVDWTKKAASIGADVVELDELIAKLNAEQADVESIIKAGLALNPNLQFIITEYNQYYFECAYSWTSQFPSVRVADDEYDDKARIDMNIELGSQYAKRAFTWLIIANPSTSFDCYLHLNDWISYVKQRNTDVLFYWIDNGMDWQHQWTTVLSF
jgi:hypothetical protein